MREHTFIPLCKTGYCAFMTAALAGLLLISFSSCNISLGGPDQGTGKIVIHPFAPASRTAVPAASENLSVTVTLSGGPGGPVSAVFGPSGGTVTVEPGAWQLAVEARNDAGRLRAIQEQGPQAIQVTPGSAHNIALKACIGVSTDTDLRDALDGTLYSPDTANGDLIVLERDITASMATTGILQVQGRDVTIIAEPGTTRTLTQAAFTVNSGASLTLGRAGETGWLVFDGNGLDYFAGGYGSFALYAASGSLTINGNTEIKNCENSNGQGGAITVTNGGSLTINGGDIHDNRNTETGGSSHGGAIFVEDSTFVMNGGTIRNNSANDAGGGVYIAASSSPASFEMNGGTIDNNTVTSTGSANGGGVYNDGMFTMFDGTISNNTVTGSGLTGGGGVFQTSNPSNSLFTMNGGSITGNKALGGAGGGIQGSSGGSLLDLKGGTISNNTATGSGGGVYCDSIDSMTGSGVIGAVVISGNTAGQGGGVYGAPGFSPGLGVPGFNGTIITGNNATNPGGIGGVYNFNGGTAPAFTPATDFIYVTFGGNTSNGAPGSGDGFDYNINP
ncbi:hypothetical protein AGMMS50268_08630 [Spirochaetia bacterium]|nr:hypothetical protein AGMMS50268_08630 [Spirochaetia bacterium]